MNLTQQLITGLEKLNLTPNAILIEKFIKYLDLLQKWNKAYNLTTINDPEKIISHHFLDSVSIYSYIYGSHICDVGCGAGFPGIPLALILPEKYFCLIESSQKKISFLKQVIYTLELPNVEVMHQRAEKFIPEFCFDSVVTRAFSSLNNMLKITDHLCCKTGKFLAMKGKIPTSELNQLSQEYEVEIIKRLDIPGMDSERHLIVIKSCKSK